MKFISLNSVDASIALVDNLSDDALSILCEKHASRQPELIDYILSAAVEYENSDLEGLLIYYFCLLLESYELEGIELKKVDVIDIESFEEEFLSVLESYFENENLELLEEYTGQPDLVHFMLVEISTPDEDGTTLEDETGIQLFISMMALISIIAKTNS
ncbi:MAG: hypothetical protein FJX84_06375 [Bacteroidetes bacterium]|nr:hypothetical protein [Bacteroidota bacterium]